MPLCWSNHSNGRTKLSIVCVCVCVCLQHIHMCVFTCCVSHVGGCVVCFFQGQVISHLIKAATIFVSSVYKWQNNPCLIIERKTWGEGNDYWWLSLHKRNKPKGCCSFTSEAGIWQQWDTFQTSLYSFCLALVQGVGSSEIMLVCQCASVRREQWRVAASSDFTRGVVSDPVLTLLMNHFHHFQHMRNWQLKTKIWLKKRDGNVRLGVRKSNIYI